MLQDSFRIEEIFERSFFRGEVGICHRVEVERVINHRVQLHIVVHHILDPLSNRSFIAVEIGVWGVLVVVACAAGKDVSPSLVLGPRTAVYVLCEVSDGLGVNAFPFLGICDTINQASVCK